ENDVPVALVNELHVEQRGIEIPHGRKVVRHDVVDGTSDGRNRHWLPPFRGRKGTGPDLRPDVGLGPAGTTEARLLNPYLPHPRGRSGDAGDPPVRRPCPWAGGGNRSPARRRSSPRHAPRPVPP